MKSGKCPCVKQKRTKGNIYVKEGIEWMSEDEIEKNARKLSSVG